MDISLPEKEGINLIDEKIKAINTMLMVPLQRKQATFNDLLPNLFNTLLFLMKRPQKSTNTLQFKYYTALTHTTCMRMKQNIKSQLKQLVGHFLCSDICAENSQKKLCAITKRKHRLVPS